MDNNRRGSFMGGDPFVIRPEELMELDSTLPNSTPSPNSADEHKKEWSLLKYGSRLIPKSIKKFGDTIRSLSQSEDEQWISKSKERQTTDGDDDDESSENEEIVKVKVNHGKKKKVIRANFGSQSQDETSQDRQMRLPKRAKSHPIPRKPTLVPSSISQPNSKRSQRRKSMTVGFNVDTVSTQIPEIKISDAKESGSRKLNPPRPPPPKCFQSNSPIKCQRCLQFLDDMKRTMKGARSRREKYQILTCVPTRCTIDVDDGDVLAREFDCSEALAYSALALRATMGAFSYPVPQFVQHIPEYMKSTIQQFFLDVENSGGMKMSKGDLFDYGAFFGSEGKKRKAMFVSLSELYHEYLQVHFEHRRCVNISRFAYFIPRNIVWSKPFIGDAYDCCMVHENTQLLLQACTTYFSEGISRLLSVVVCSPANVRCMLGFCDKCPSPGSLTMLNLDCTWEEDVEYYIWKREHESSKDNGVTAPMTLTHVNEPTPAFIGRLSNLITETFLKHQFMYSVQRDFLMQMNSYLCLEGNSALVKMDFCEPYTALKKIGPMKSNLVDFDPRNEVAIHPFCIKYYEADQGKVETKFVVVISNLLTENGTASYIFRAEMVKWIRHALPHIRKIIYCSDDNPVHYKNPETIFNLLYHEEDFKLKAEHEYFVEGHENQEVLTVVTQIKRRCRLACLSGEAEIGNAEEMFQFCRKELERNNLLFSYLNGFVRRVRTLERKLEMRYKVNNSIVPGLKWYYSFRPEFGKDGSKDVLHLRRFSLSKNEKLLRVRLSTGHHQSEMQTHEVTQYIPYVEGRGRVQLDPDNFVHGNVVTVNLEGGIYKGKIERHDKVELGDLLVTLFGKMEKCVKTKNKKRGEDEECFVNWQREKTVWISTLDVIAVSQMVPQDTHFSKDFSKRLRRLSSAGRKEGCGLEDDDGRSELKRRSSSLSPSKFLASLHRREAGITSK